ncbi:MAG: archease [Anaerolineales bacterium]|nr:archease [Anaerolineales bacterium]
MGFEEIPHTADWSLRVWADDLPGLLAESARGMSWLSGVELAEGPREMRTYETEGPDDESLLVAFLSELVYYAEQENLGFDDFEINIKNDRLKVEMESAPLKSLNKAIKAVTWHNLKIIETAKGLEVEIVFDV